MWCSSRALTSNANAKLNRMDKSTANEAAPYLQGLGLAFAPFVGAPETLPFFNAPSRRKTLDMILYLARYSDLALLVHGPTGCGKTALLREITARAGLNIHPVMIEGQPTVTASLVFDTLLNSFKLLNAPPAAEQQLAQIKEQLDHLQRKGYHSVITIDNADRLAPDAYTALEQLIDLRSDAGRNLLNVVLFAQHPDKITLRGPSVRHRIKRIEVPPLATEEIAQYLQHCMHYAGGDAVYSSAFNPRAVTQITRDSHGWPGAINALAQQKLLRFATRKNPATLPVEMRAFSKKQFAGMAVAASLLLAVIAFQTQINEAFNTPATIASIPPEPVTTPAPTAPEPVTEIVIPPPTVAATPVLAEPIPAPAEPIAPTTAHSEAQPAIPVEEPPAAAAIPEAVAKPEALTAPPASTPTAPASVKPAALRDDWLLAQNPDVFTLQVAGSPDESDVRRALKKYGFVSDTAIFTTQKKGKPWYGLVTGIYMDAVSAQQARAALPEELMRGTWVRRMRAVQGEIHKLADTGTPSDVTGNGATSPAKTSETN